MSASPVLLNPAQLTPHRTVRITPHRSVRIVWLPVFCGLVSICFTSTVFMGGSHTQVWVNAVWQTVLGNWHFRMIGDVNEYLRKTGHFFGYGVISLLFRNAWYSSARAMRWVKKGLLMPFAASSAVASTFVIGCLDEWHQTFLPGRVGCLRDALLDTAGALFLNLVIWTIYTKKCHKTSSEPAISGLHLSTQACRGSNPSR